jgi:hypothetical protein
MNSLFVIIIIVIIIVVFRILSRLLVAFATLRIDTRCHAVAGSELEQSVLVLSYHFSMAAALSMRQRRAAGGDLVFVS